MKTETASTLKELFETLAGVKEEYPLYKPFIEIEYHLDLDRVAVLPSFPYENDLDSDFELELVGHIAVEDVYDFVNELVKVNDSIIICDTTEGEYYHDDSLENTLKEHSHLFKIGYFGSRDWQADEATLLNRRDDLVYELAKVVCELDNIKVNFNDMEQSQMFIDVEDYVAGYLEAIAKEQREY